MPATIRSGSSIARAWACAWTCAWACASLTGCPPFPVFCTDEECPSSTSLPVFTTGELPAPTSSVGGGGFQTVTGDEQTSTGAPSPWTGTDATATGEAIEPPVIVDHDLQPGTIKANGPIEVLVAADHADGVTMVLENGDESELAAGEPGLFHGSFDVLTGLINGPHVVALTPWRDAVTGALVEAPYEVDLPEPGSQLFWETSDELGPGRVVALGVLPDGQVVEFGTHFPGGGPRCYLRRRDKTGVPNDIAFVLPGIDCTAVDMQVDDQGTLFVLVHRNSVNGVRWWYGRLPAWGKGAKPIADGTEDETAVALALHPSGKLAVCGHVPMPSLDVDVMVQIFEPNADSGVKLTLDYWPEGKKSHSFFERARDCVYAGDTLALVGEAFGPHALEPTKRERLFILRLENDGTSAAWTIALPGVRSQSGAQAVDVDDEGRLVVAGYTCDDVCNVEGDLRIYDAMNELKWQVSLGAFEDKTSATQDLAWSPAGYAIVATGGLKDSEGAFTVRAFGQSQVLPLWTFTHKDIKALDLALALALGHYGEVYAGGMAVNGFPAFAYIGG